MTTKYTNIMKRLLYHGSEFIIEKPECGKGNLHNDYGLGFYCSFNETLAKEWAARKSGHGFVNRYAFRDDRLRILDLTKPPFDNVLYWISLLMHNRSLSSDLTDACPREIRFLKDNYLIDVSYFDVVIGYRADDSYFRFPEAFVRSEITLESLNKVFRAGDLGKQYVLVSERAHRLIHFLDYREVFESSKEDYYRRKAFADKVFAELRNEDRYSKGVRLRDMVMDYE